MTDRDELIQRVAQTLKEPVAIDPALATRVMAEIEGLPAPGRRAAGARSVLAWLRRPRTISVSPLGAMAAAAGLAALLLGGRAVFPAWDGGAAPEASVPAAPGATLIQFVLVAPEAGAVSVVGDFNDWNVEATPLVRDRGDGVWSVTVPLEPGRYRYSFLVDGTTWRDDPHAASTLADEFGPPSSVIMVGGA